MSEQAMMAPDGRRFKINALLDRERGHKLDGVAADCYRRAIGLTAKRLRETASDIEAGQ